MIDYHTFHQIRQLCDVEQLSAAQIARRLNLHPQTVYQWRDRPKYQRRAAVVKRKSKLDPFKPTVVRLLAQHPYSAQQLFQRLQDSGYTGGYSILKHFVRQVRPTAEPAFLTLQFAPGQSAQVDWGSAGWLRVGTTRRRLSFFVMVFCYSRRMYVEFTLAQTQEHFLACHQRAFEYLNGVSSEIMVDNCKTAVLSHPPGQPAVFHPRYLDFARHYGFTIKACGPRKPHEKGRVEKAVHYVKQNFLAGLELASLEALNAAARRWLDEVANVRVHGETHQVPRDLFLQEQPHLRPLTVLPYDLASVQTVLVSRRARVTLDTNRYSVPPAFAGKQLLLKGYPDRLCLYHQDQLIAEHTRRYDRHQDYEQPEHVAELLAQRRQARQQQHFTRFLALSPRARDYYQRLAEKRGNPQHHVQKIVALSEIHGVDKVQRALEDAWAYQAFSCEYIANLLDQQARPPVEPGALHLTRQQDLLDLELPAPDFSLYERAEGGPQ
jgi:transposase